MDENEMLRLRIATLESIIIMLMMRVDGDITKEDFDEKASMVMTGGGPFGAFDDDDAKAVRESYNKLSGSVR